MAGHFSARAAHSIWMARTFRKLFSTWCLCTFNPFLPWWGACSPQLPPYVFPFCLSLFLLTNECQPPRGLFLVLNEPNPFLPPSPHTCCSTSWQSCLLPVLQDSAQMSPCPVSSEPLPRSSHSLYPLNSLLALTNIYIYLKI